MNPLNIPLSVAWIVFVATFTLCWTVSTGLITYYEPRQAQISLFYLEDFIKKFPAPYSSLPLSAEEIVSRLNRHRLQITTIPDPINSLKIFRGYVLSILMSSALLLVIILILNLIFQFHLGPSETEVTAVSLWISIFSIIINLLCVSWTIYKSVDLEIISAVMEIARVDELLVLVGIRR
ncbi:MAG: hypothetical protein M3247_07165 [Thermoproteota archaeon]|nr:hypothetical protein [Thermoproteota archaeon]